MEWSKARILTPRGWGLAGAGLFCVLLAQIMGRKDLLVLGLFLILLPVLAAIGVRLLAPDFTVYREFTPAVVEAESSTTVDLAVGGPLRTAGRVRMSETLPPRFGRSPEFFYPGKVQNDGKAGLRSSRYQYHLRSASRGQFPIGPVNAEISDAFGLSTHQRSLPGSDLLTVTPRALELPVTTVSGARSSDGVIATGQRANPSDDDVMTREYRHGDPMRRVHWPATARQGQLMVRQEESVTTPEATLLLDLRAGAFADGGSPARNPGGEHPELRSSAAFEWSVVAAMSISAHLVERSFELRLLDVFGKPGLASSRSAPEALTEEYAGVAGLHSIAESLAAIELQEDQNGTAFNDDLLERLSSGRQRGPVIAILGQLSTAEARALAVAAQGSPAACAIVSSHHPEQAAQTLELLRQGGWRAIAANEGTSLRSVWSYFDAGPLETATAEQPPSGSGVPR